MRAEQIFEILDFNGDGQLDEDEFVAGCMEDQELISLLNSGGLEELTPREEEGEEERFEEQ